MCRSHWTQTLSFLLYVCVFKLSLYFSPSQFSAAFTAPFLAFRSDTQILSPLDESRWQLFFVPPKKNGAPNLILCLFPRCSLCFWSPSWLISPTSFRALNQISWIPGRPPSQGFSMSQLTQYLRSPEWFILYVWSVWYIILVWSIS